MGLLVLIILGALNVQAARVCNFTRVSATFNGRPAQVLADGQLVTDWGGMEFYTRAMSLGATP